MNLENGIKWAFTTWNELCILQMWASIVMVPNNKCILIVCFASSRLHQWLWVTSSLRALSSFGLKIHKQGNFRLSQLCYQIRNNYHHNQPSHVSYHMKIYSHWKNQFQLIICTNQFKSLNNSREKCHLISSPKTSYVQSSSLNINSSANRN